MDSVADPVEAVFDSVFDTLSGSRQFRRLRKAGVVRLTAMIEAYHEQQRVDMERIRYEGTGTSGSGPEREATRKRCRSETSVTTESTADSGSGLQEADAIDLAAAEKAEQCLTVAQSLTKLRKFLQQRVPFGSIADNQQGCLPGKSSVHERTQPESCLLGPAAAVGGVQARESCPSTVGTEARGTPPAPTYEVDSFLYLEEDVEELVSKGLLSREYCLDCGSTRRGPTEFVSHSLSQAQLEYLSCFLLPPVLAQAKKLPGCSEPDRGFRIVDVGSRLGIVLASLLFAADSGALDCSENAPLTITGIEMNAVFAGIQRQALSRLTRCQPTVTDLAGRTSTEPRGVENSGTFAKVVFSVRLPLSKGPLNCRTHGGGPALAPNVVLQVICDDCFSESGAAEELRKADVVVLHNVFEFFASPVNHLNSWVKLRNLVARSGQLLVCSPSIEETMQSFSTETVQACFGDAACNERAAARCMSSLQQEWLTPVSGDVVSRASHDFFALRCNRDDSSSSSDGEHPEGRERRPSPDAESVDDEVREQIHALHVYRVL